MTTASKQKRQKEDAMTDTNAKDLHDLLTDTKKLLEDCSPIGILDIGWRTRREGVIKRIETALGYHMQLEDEGHEHGQR